jgi:hypothetical protein
MNVDSLSVKPIDKPMVYGTYPGLTEFLLRGARYKGGASNHIHAFLSGGGLRVVRAEDEKKGLVGYGEYPHVEEALRLCEVDYLAGKRDYKEVYGKETPHYLTGSSTPSSKLDQWTRIGRSWNIYCDHKGNFVFDSEYHYDISPSKERADRILATGVAEEWVSPTTGFTYRSSKSAFPSGDPCVSTECLQIREHNGAECWMPKKAVNYTAATLEELLVLVNKEFETIHDKERGE